MSYNQRTQPNQSVKHSPWFNWPSALVAGAIPFVVMLLYMLYLEWRSH